MCGLILQGLCRHALDLEVAVDVSLRVSTCRVPVPFLTRGRCQSWGQRSIK